jgi:hypothetical protein
VLRWGPLYWGTARMVTNFPVVRHPLAPIETAVLLSRPVPPMAPSLKVGLGPSRQENCPCTLKIGARLIEACGRTIGKFAGIEAAVPLPLRSGVGIADAFRNRPDPALGPFLWPILAPQ